MYLSAEFKSSDFHFLNYEFSRSCLLAEVSIVSAHLWNFDIPTLFFSFFKAYLPSLFSSAHPSLLRTGLSHSWQENIPRSSFPWTWKVIYTLPHHGENRGVWWKRHRCIFHVDSWHTSFCLVWTLMFCDFLKIKEIQKDSHIFANTHSNLLV